MGVEFRVPLELLSATQHNKSTMKNQQSNPERSGTTKLIGKKPCEIS
jgi:hypothetical protein